MGIIAGANINDNGLIFSLDAANFRSYTGSGVTLYGLVGGINGAFVNGTGFSTANNGSFFFNGSNHMPFDISPYTNNIMTIELWANLKNFSLTMPFGFLEYDVFTYLGGIGFNTNNSDVYGISSASVTSLGIENNWAHYIFEMRSDVSYSNNKIYINSVLQTLTTLIGTEDATKRNFNNGVGRISGYNFNGSYKMLMNLGLFNIYNRALAAQEIKQNYNATKKRYGL